MKDFSDTYGECHNSSKNRIYISELPGLYIFISKHISYINRSYKSFTNIYKSDISRIKKIGIIDSKKSLIPIFFNERIF